MALFKIEKGLAANLSAKRPNTVEGYCYFTTDDGKFYIDVATGSGTSKRVVLNAGTADKLRTPRTISLTGAVTGSGNFDGSNNLTIDTTSNHNHNGTYVKLSGSTMTGNLEIKNENPYVKFTDTANND